MGSLVCGDLRPYYVFVELTMGKKVCFGQQSVAEVGAAREGSRGNAYRTIICCQSSEVGKPRPLDQEKPRTRE